MEEDIFREMNMVEPLSSKDLKQFFFCKDVNVSGNYHMHGTYDGRMTMPMMIVMLVLGFVTFFVNLGVIIRTIKILRHGHDNKPAFYYIGNLALSDLALGLYIIIAFLLHITNKMDLWQEKTCSLQIGVAVTACQETIFTIMLIAVDKYLYICHALRYHQIVTMTRVYVAVISSWIISLIIGSLPAMGMMMKWEETCGRCIFAQVVSKNFAILFFVTAVAFPYAVAVTLYSILLFLAIKMQKARYGGSYNVPEAGKVSLFRLSFMSKKSTRSRASVSSTIKSITSKATLSTTGSNASSVSVSKTHRRRMRKQAMQEYKASLPGLNTKGEDATLVRVTPTKTSEDLNPLPNDAADETDGEIETRLMKVEDSNMQESLPLRNSQKDKDKVGPTESDIQMKTTVVTIDKVNGTEVKTVKDVSKIHQDTGDAVISVYQTDNENPNSANEVTVADVNNGTGSNTRKNDVVPKNEIAHTDAFSDEEDVSVLPLSRCTSTEECNAQSGLKGRLKKQSSESSKSSKSLPSLTDTEVYDDESFQRDAEARWSVSKYFNRIVSDTKDKVLFLKKCRAVKTVFLIIGSFTVTYVPFVVGSLVYSLEKEKSKPLLHALQTILFIAIVANSLANPLLYAYGYSEFRIRTKKFKGVFATEKRPKL